MEDKVAAYKSELDEVCKDIDAHLDKLQRNLLARDFCDQADIIRRKIYDAEIPLANYLEEAEKLRKKLEQGSGDVNEMIERFIFPIQDGIWTVQSRYSCPVSWKTRVSNSTTCYTIRSVFGKQVKRRQRS